MNGTSESGGFWRADLNKITNEKHCQFGREYISKYCDGQLLLEQLFRLGTEKDILINLRHIMDFGDEEFEILIMNTNTVVHNMIELAKIAGRYV
jgi:hypothetical protein